MLNHKSGRPGMEEDRKRVSCQVRPEMSFALSKVISPKGPPHSTLECLGKPCNQQMQDNYLYTPVIAVQSRPENLQIILSKVRRVKVTMRKESVTKETPHLDLGVLSLVTLGTCPPHVSPPPLWKEAVSRAPRSLCTSCQHIMVMVATGA